MTEFLCDRLIRRTRKVHHCEACGTAIQIGLPAVRSASICDASAWSWYSHVECRAAETAWNITRGLYDDDWLWLWQWAESDWPEFEAAWMVAHHPIAAGRMGISIEGCSPRDRAYWRWAA